MKYLVRLTPDADEQILDQARYIAEHQKAPLEAGRWLGRIYDAVDGLEEMPRSFSIAEEDEFKEYEVRKRGIDGFNLLFTVFDEKQEVWIIATRARGMEVNPKRLPDSIETIAARLRGGDRGREESSNR